MIETRGKIQDTRKSPLASCVLLLFNLAMKDTPYHYGLVSRLLHWTLAILIIANLVTGLLLDDMPKDLRFQVISWHKSCGVVILALMLARFIWRSLEGFPKFPDIIPAWQKNLARIGHIAFYPLLIAQPITGWLLSSASGYPVNFFGLFLLPLIWNKDKTWAKTFDLAHDVLGYAILALLVIHILAALYHHFIQGDKIIRRML